MNIDIQDIEQLVQKNLGLAHNYAKKQEFLGVDYDEAYSDGLFALHQAILEYDPERGKLSTFFHKVAENNVINDWRKRQRDVLTNDEVELLELDVQIEQPGSFNEDWHEIVKQCIDNLEDSESEIINRVYGFNNYITITDLAAELGKSKSAVSQRVHRICAKLKCCFLEKGLNEVIK